MKNVVHNMDCLEFLKTQGDNAFDLAIVDPPYGGGAKESKNQCSHTGGTWAAKYQPNANIGGGGIKCNHAFGGKAFGKYTEQAAGSNEEIPDIRKWDIAPPEEYWRELFRVSKNQIVWGGNYFALPPTRCFIVWRKAQIPDSGFTMSPVEYAWTSFNKNALYFKCFSSGNTNYIRFHPTQKPIELYKFILKNFAKPGDKILDTHVRSGSIRIACYEDGFDFEGCEISEFYFKKQEERFKAATLQNNLFEFVGGQIKED